MNKDRTVGRLLLGLMGISFFIFTVFGKAGTLLMSPLMTTAEYLAQWPYTTLGNIIIQQPSSSIIILVLSILTVGLGFHYLSSKTSYFSYWLGVNFIFWGLGAFLAGLSYQAFGYALKCSGLSACMFTDWVELLYMSLTVLSINAILMAYADLSRSYKEALTLKRFAMFSVIAYMIFQGIGMMVPVQFMVSYEGMLLFLSPNLIMFIMISFKQRKEILHHRLLNIWIAFIFVNLAYFVALFADIGALIMNSTGFWFNENDTLHVLLILWMLAWWIWIPKNGFKKHPDKQTEASL